MVTKAKPIPGEKGSARRSGGQGAETKPVSVANTNEFQRIMFSGVQNYYGRLIGIPFPDADGHSPASLYRLPTVNAIREKGKTHWLKTKEGSLVDPSIPNSEAAETFITKITHLEETGEKMPVGDGDKKVDTYTQQGLLIDDYKKAQELIQKDQVRQIELENNGRNALAVWKDGRVSEEWQGKIEGNYKKAAADMDMFHWQQLNELGDLLKDVDREAAKIILDYCGKKYDPLGERTKGKNAQALVKKLQDQGHDHAAAAARALFLQQQEQKKALASLYNTRDEQFVNRVNNSLRIATLCRFAEDFGYKARFHEKSDRDFLRTDDFAMPHWMKDLPNGYVVKVDGKGVATASVSKDGKDPNGLNINMRVSKSLPRKKKIELYGKILAQAIAQHGMNRIDLGSLRKVLPSDKDVKEVAKLVAEQCGNPDINITYFGQPMLTADECAKAKSNFEAWCKHNEYGSTQLTPKKYELTGDDLFDPNPASTARHTATPIPATGKPTATPVPVTPKPTATPVPALPTAEDTDYVSFSTTPPGASDEPEVTISTEPPVDLEDAVTVTTIPPHGSAPRPADSMLSSASSPPVAGIAEDPAVSIKPIQRP